MAIASTWQRARDVAVSAEIMRRRGLVRPLRVGETRRVLQVARRAGPLAAMIVVPARSAPGTPAITGDSGPLSYGELESRANALSRGLAAAGLRPGDVAGILCRDDTWPVLALIAAARLGVRVVLMNTGFGAPQLAEVVRRDRVTALILDAEFLPLTTALPAGVRRILTETCDDTGEAPALSSLIAGRPGTALPLPPRPGGMVLLTSGTTGAPKGAPRDRISPLQSAQLLDRIPLTRGGTMVLATPLFHGTGLGQFMLAMTLGRHVVLRRRFEPEAALADIAAHRADTLVVVPTMLQRIVSLGPDVRARYDTSSLRIIVSAGSALPPELCRAALAAFGDVLYNIYGSTEVANASVATPAELRRAPGTVGRAPVGGRIVLYDEQRRPVTGAARPGTIFVRNGLSFTGYTDGSRKEVVDGALCTGDVGHFDADGLLFVDGREDEMIVSGGENVFPAEVENLLAGRPDVADAAVIGVPDPEFGQRLRAFVVAGPGVTLDAQEIRDFVRASLARYQVPRDVIFVTELPRNATGKLQRGQLEETGPLEERG
jgi:fatty-acyl-CoA synthase